MQQRQANTSKIQQVAAGMRLVATALRAMRHTAGFTLIEILMVVALVSILAAVTVPILAGAMDRYAVVSAGQQVVSTIRAARFQAMARNSGVRVHFDSPAAGQYQTEAWNETTMTWDALGDVQHLPTGIGLVGDAVDIQIEPTGRPPTAARCPCSLSVTNGNAGDDRVITVSASGRVQIQ
jgi:prepilin-type N-terminal cleavage/methylation domain-containing protein